MSVATLMCALESIHPVWLQDKIYENRQLNCIQLICENFDFESGQKNQSKIANRLTFVFAFKFISFTLNHLLDDMLAIWLVVLHHLTPITFGHQLFVQSPPSSNKINVDHVVAFYIWISTNKRGKRNETKTRLISVAVNFRLTAYAICLALNFRLTACACIHTHIHMHSTQKFNLQIYLYKIKLKYLRRSWATTSLLVVSHWMPSVLYSMSRRKHAVNTLIVVCKLKKEKTNNSDTVNMCGSFPWIIIIYYQMFVDLFIAHVNINPVIGIFHKILLWTGNVFCMNWL